MENILKKGNLVSFYDGGCTGRVINEDGEMDVWDWHLYSSGRVLTVFEDQVLVLLYSHIDENPRPFENMFLDEISTAWVSTKYLRKEPKRK